MMAMEHAFFAHLPNWFGFLVLIGIWILFRGFLLRWRRGSMERMWQGAQRPIAPPVAPVMAGQVRCPRCSAHAPQVAAFCPKCGLALNSPPPPIPRVQYAAKPGRSPWLLLVYVLLGVIGLAAFRYWRSGGWDEENAATPAPPPEIRHTHAHDYRWSR